MLQELISFVEHDWVELQGCIVTGESITPPFVDPEDSNATSAESPIFKYEGFNPHWKNPVNGLRLGTRSSQDGDTNNALPPSGGDDRRYS